MVKKNLLLSSFDWPLTKRCIPLIVPRQEHRIVFEVAALGAKAGWAPSRKDLLAFGGITFPFGCRTLSCSAAGTLRRSRKSWVAWSVRDIRQKRCMYKCTRHCAMGRVVSGCVSAGGLFWPLYNEYICSGGSGSVALLFLDWKINNQSCSELEETQLFDSH